MSLNLDKRNLTDDVADIIRKMILNGTIKPGSKVNQVQLSEQLDISRGPVREALKLLEYEGLIRHITNKGTFVSTLSKKDAYEIYSLRALLESEGAALAVKHLQPSNFESLQNLISDFHETEKQKDVEGLMRLDFTFHEQIMKQSKHQRLINVHQQLNTQLGAMFLTMSTKVPIRINQAAAHHQHLVDALQTNDPQLIRTAFSDHYTQAYEDLSKMYIS